MNDIILGGIETTDTSAIEHKCDLLISQNSEADIEQDADPGTMLNSYVIRHVNLVIFYSSILE